MAQGLPTVRRDRATALALYHPSKGTPYMGRYPDQRLAGTTQLGRATNWRAPLEDPSMGCPGAWYRTPFIDSLEPYYRRRDGNGGRIPNPRFDAADWQIQAAIMKLEEEEERWHRYVSNEQYERAKKRAEEHAAAAAKRGRGR